jgi:hypothetical protein
MPIPMPMPRPFLDFGTFMLRPGDFIRLYPKPFASEIYKWIVNIMIQQENCDSNDTCAADDQTQTYDD